jgi:NAD(P)-dependent dehydrogenase (short-subunit alcohol dehydrogenase family)
MVDHLRGKVVLITGGSSGFGLATARQLLERGAQVAITGRDAARLKAAAATLGGEVLAIQADAVHTPDWQRTLQQVTARYGRLDGLVNNHGAGVKIAPIEQQDDAAIESALAINLTSVIRGCREALAVMRPQGHGHIINVASVCAAHAWAEWGPYTAAKAGLVAFTRVLHLEMQSWGGKATSFIPGAARTGFSAAASLDDSWQTGLPDGEDFARELVKTLDVPPHVFVEEVTVWGTKQVLNPF